MLRIVLKDGIVCKYHNDEFTEYEWKKEVFVVIKNNQWIAMFNWDCVASVFYEDELAFSTN